MTEQKTDSPSCRYSTSTAQEINLIKEWISKQPHLPQQHDDEWLEIFLKGCKYSVERFKVVFDNFYTMRSKFPQYFLNGDPTAQNIKEVVQVYYHIVLPDKSEDCNYISCGLLETDVSKMDVEAGMCRGLLLCNHALKMKASPTYVIVCDIRGSSLAHVTKVFPFLKDFIFMIQDAMPFHFKEIHYINANKVLKTLLSMITPLLREKVRNRIHVHTDDLSTLYEFVPKEFLPNEFGGKSGTIQQLNNEVQNNLENMRDALMEEYKKKTDESKRIKDSTENELFGIQGTFKSLNID